MPGSIESVRAFLDERDVAYEVVEHAQRFTAAAEARASGVEPHDAAKEVVLKRDDGYLLAVIPASERLDMHKARELVEEGVELRLATEDEIGEGFPQFELGALPPFGPMLGVEEIVDRRLLDHVQVLCNAGDHRHSLRVDPSDLVRVGDARVADISQD